jgi:hypothetical protein
MGQYYKAVFLKNRTTVAGWFHPHEFDNGMKLTEHSWIGNTLLSAVMRHIYKNPTNLVWAGDYADPTKGRKNNTYTLCDNNKKLKPTIGYHKSLRYIVNHDKKQFVDLKHCPVQEVYNGNDWRIHPLSLLTAEGNGRGGGDYHGFTLDLVGSWARDKISSVKISKDIPKGFKELKPDFI